MGTLLAGYPRKSPAVQIHDDLLVSGLAFDDGKTRALLLSFDLIGLEEESIRRIKMECAKICDIDPENILLTCTHTHSGPYTISVHQRSDTEYLENLFVWVQEAVEDAFVDMTEVLVFHYSVAAHENINRRIVFPDNSCLYLPDNKHLHNLADGVVDPELGILFFMNNLTKENAATLVNYAAHPLSSQTGGISSSTITSDYPYYLRDQVEKEIGGTCIFIQGAAGDLHPKEFECGFTATEKMGKNLARKVIHAYYAIGGYYDYLQTEPEKRYQIINPEIKTHTEKFMMNFREGDSNYRKYFQKREGSIEAELQYLLIGDICLVGVPGELLVEPGLEIKWHSPFQKTFILYNSTAYLSYIAHTNTFVSSGYEPDTSPFDKFSAFDLVSCAIKGFRELKP